MTLLSCCGHGVPLGCYCAPCRQIDDAADVPAEGNPPEPAPPSRLSRWPEYLGRGFLSRWRWPSDAEGAE